MINSILQSTFSAVRNQGYQPAYIAQAMPVLGAIVSAPTALYSGIMAIVKIAQAVFQKIKHGTPFFRSDDPEWQYSHLPMEDARDLGIIFLNNVINICTLGVLNNLFVWLVVSNSGCGRDDDD